MDKNYNISTSEYHRSRGQFEKVNRLKIERETAWREAKEYKAEMEALGHPVKTGPLTAKDIAKQMKWRQDQKIIFKEIE